MMQRVTVGVATALSLSLTGCGGGGTTTSAPTTTFAPAIAVEKYPGYTGNLTVTGTIEVRPMDGTRVSFAWDLEGLETSACDTPPTGVPLACGIHIHEGKTCSDASAVGGHYYNNQTETSDPWTNINYTTKDTPGKAAGHEMNLVIGAGDIQGRAFVVHDSKGGRVGCALIPAELLARMITVSVAGASISECVEESLDPAETVVEVVANDGNHCGHHYGKDWVGVTCCNQCALVSSPIPWAPDHFVSDFKCIPGPAPSCPSPMGSYSQSCFDCTVDRACDLHCTCDNGNGMDVEAVANLNECADLANIWGVLTCDWATTSPAPITTTVTWPAWTTTAAPTLAPTPAPTAWPTWTTTMWAPVVMV